MGKYTYNRVESVRGIDLTGNTQYYTFGDVRRNFKTLDEHFKEVE